MLSIFCAIALATCPGGAVCLDGDQSVSGHKHWAHLSFFDGNYDLGNGLYGDIYAAHGIGADRVFPTQSGRRLWLIGRAGVDDVDPSVVITSDKWRANPLLTIYQGAPCVSVPLFTFGGDGVLSYGASVDSSCQGAQGGYLLHRGGLSGAPSLVREPGYYMYLSSSISADSYLHNEVNMDGTDPAWDGGTWVNRRQDGSTYYEQASRHGNFQ